MDDEPFLIRQTFDEGFIIAGESYSNDNDVSGNHGVSDYWIVKTDDVGTIQWQKTLGGTSYDVGTSIQQLSDHGYIIAGFSRSNDGDVTGHHGTSSYNDYWIVRIDSLANILWQKSLGGTLNEFTSTVEQTSDGGFIVGGYSYSTDGDVTGHHGGAGVADFWIVKLDDAGNLLWQKCLGGTFNDFNNSILETPDHGFIAAGATVSNDGDVSGNHGLSDEWMVKLDSTGNMLWQKCFGGTNDDGASEVVQTTDGSYVTAGWSASNDGDVSGNHGSDDYWVVKMDGTGNLLWQKSLGGNAWDYGTAVTATTEGGYVVAGYTASPGGDVSGYHGGSFWGDYWVAGLDASGNLSWQKCLGGTNDEAAASVQQTNDGAIMVAGWTQSNDGDVTLNYGSADFWIVALSVPTTVDDKPNPTSLLSVFPNPVTDFLNLEFQIQNNESFNAVITISNLLGQTISKRSVHVSNGHLQEVIPLDEKFSKGIYFVNVINNEHQGCSSFIKSR